MAATGLTLTVRSSQLTEVKPDLSHLSSEKRAEYEATHARMMAALPYERVTVPGAQAQAEWERLRGAGRGWPVVIGDDEQLERIADQFSIDDPAVWGSGNFMDEVRAPATIIEAAGNLQFPEDLARWPGAYREEDLQAPLGDWPEDIGSGGDDLSVASDALTGKFFESVHILLIPASASWQVPAFLRWGNWNACPPPEYHVAALRSWHQRYGAELVGINGDTMNVRVASRPGDRAEAISLARDQYRYCPDIIDQGVEDVSTLAAILMAQDWWYFWWD
jgi:hypothetical protein